MAGKPTFTPGPWHAQDSIVLDGRGLTVSHCLISSGGNGFIDPHQCLANAHLIASAPALYEALEATQAALETAMRLAQGRDDYRLIETLQIAYGGNRAALKLARGEG